MDPATFSVSLIKIQQAILPCCGCVEYASEKCKCHLCIQHSVCLLHRLYFCLFKLYDSKTADYFDTAAKTKTSNKDNANGDSDDDKPIEKTIFIDRLLKLAIEDRVFTDQNVLDELKTVLLAVRRC